MTLGKLLKQYRLINNISQSDVASKLHISRQAISRWETDKSVPDFETLLKLCTLYKIDISDLNYHTPIKVACCKSVKNILNPKLLIATIVFFVLCLIVFNDNIPNSIRLLCSSFLLFTGIFIIFFLAARLFDNLK